MTVTTAHFAPLGTPLPRAQEPLDTAFVSLGPVTQPDAETTQSTQDVHNWSGDRIRVLQDSFALTIKFAQRTWTSLPPLETTSWVFDDTLQGRVVIPVARVVNVAPKITLKVFRDVNGHAAYTHCRTWEQTWNDHVGAALEGDTQLAAALLAELATGYPESRLEAAAAAAAPITLFTVNGTTPTTGIYENPRLAGKRSRLGLTFDREYLDDWTFTNRPGQEMNDRAWLDSRGLLPREHELISSADALQIALERNNR